MLRGFANAGVQKETLSFSYQTYDVSAALLFFYYSTSLAAENDSNRQ
jgi:hypothetical protein